MATARLILIENGSQRVVELKEPVAEIGRGSETLVTIQDPRSSRKHCRLSRTAQGWLLEDLKSRNGTTLNGAPVERDLLKSGDEFRIGSIRFRFDDGAAPAAAPAEPPGAVPVEGAAAAAAGTGKGRSEEPEAASGPARAVSRPPKTGASAPAGFYLEGTEGPHLGKRIEVATLPFTIGRKPDNDFPIEDPRASSHHARIVEQKGRYLLEDLGSTNGTIVNQKRIRQAALAGGMLIRIGDSAFRVELPAAERSGPPADGEPESAAVPVPGEGVEEDDFARFNPREFLEESDRGSPLQVAAVLLVLGTLLYFAVDVTVKQLRPRDPDPSPPGNLVQNWSFESPLAGRAIPGWGLAEGDQGTVSLTRDGAQYPGRQALQLAPSGDGLCRASAAGEFTVEPGTEYRVAGQVKSLGAFACGLLVSWLGEVDGKRVEIGRDWGNGLRDDGQRELERVVRPPPAARFARLQPFVIAAGAGRGSGSFDQLFFGPSGRAAQGSAGEAGEPQPPETGEEESSAEPGEEEAGSPVLPVEVSDGSSEAAAAPGVAAHGPPIRLKVAPGGVLSAIRRGARPVVLALWVGLPPDLDPLALGPRLATTVRQAGDREGVLLSGQAADLAKGEWLPLETRVQGQGGEIHSEFRFSKCGNPGSAGHAAAEENGPSRAAVYLAVGPAVKEVAAFGGSPLRESRFAPDRPSAGPVDELLFGSGPDQVTLLFSPPVTFRAIPNPEAPGRTLLCGEAALDSPSRTGAGFQILDQSGKFVGADSRVLTARLSPYSRRENEAVAALLLDAGQSYRDGKAIEARARLEELKGRYTWRQADLSRAAEMEKEWNREAERALQELHQGLEDLKASPSPVIREALLARAVALGVRARGSPSEQGVKAVEEEVRRSTPEPAGSRKGADPALLLAKCRESLEHEQLGFAELFRRLAADCKLPAEAEKEAEHLKALIDQHRLQRAEKEER